MPDHRLTRRHALGVLAGAAGAVTASRVGRIPTVTNVVTRADPAAASVMVDPSSVVGTLPARMVSLGFEKKTLTYSLFTPGNAPVITLFNLLGPQLLRIGGNSVEREVWDAAGPGGVDGAISPSDIVRLRGFADAVDCPVIYSTPMYTGTAALVADEAAAAVQTMGPHLAGLELCNEPDLYILDPIANSVAGGPHFLPRWDSFAAAIRARAPGAPLTGPATFLLEAIANIVDEFATPARDLVMLTQHYYLGYGAGPPQTIPYMLSHDPKLDALLPRLTERAGELGVPFRLDETNSFAHGGENGVSNTFGSALFGIQHVFVSAALGCGGLNFHTAGVGQGYPAIVQINGIVQEIRPLFYGLMLAADAGSGPLLATTSSHGALDAHTVKRTPTSLAVVMRNTDPSTGLTVTVDVGAAVRSALASRLRGPSLDATTGTSYRGATVGLDGSFHPDPKEILPTGETTVSLTLPAASAALIEVALASPAIGPPTSASTTEATSLGVTTTRPANPVAQPATAVEAVPTFTG